MSSSSSRWECESEREVGEAFYAGEVERRELGGGCEKM